MRDSLPMSFFTSVSSITEEKGERGIRQYNKSVIDVTKWGLPKWKCLKLCT